MISQSPSMNWTYATSGATSRRRPTPAFLARDAVNGMDISSATTSALRERASETLSSVEPEST
jgi:hypothetical protein